MGALPPANPVSTSTEQEAKDRYNNTLYYIEFITSYLVVAIFAAVIQLSLQNDACINRDTLDIPADHLFHDKSKPLILGHRGQPRKFQENTIEGIKSVADLGADGFETDIYLTDHNQLVLFHDDNAKVHF